MHEWAYGPVAIEGRAADSVPTEKRHSECQTVDIAAPCPPPMLVEEPPPPPSPVAVWTGGYWTWQGDWVWCAGRWMEPPRERYVWVQPYYEHRDQRVILIPGYCFTSTRRRAG